MPLTCLVDKFIGEDGKENWVWFRPRAQSPSHQAAASPSAPPTNTRRENYLVFFPGDISDFYAPRSIFGPNYGIDDMVWLLAARFGESHNVVAIRAHTVNKDYDAVYKNFVVGGVSKKTGDPLKLSSELLKEVQKREEAKTRNGGSAATVPVFSEGKLAKKLVSPRGDRVNTQPEANSGNDNGNASPPSGKNNFRSLRKTLSKQLSVGGPDESAAFDRRTGNKGELKRTNSKGELKRANSRCELVSSSAGSAVSTPRGVRKQAEGASQNSPRGNKAAFEIDAVAHLTKLLENVVRRQNESAVQSPGRDLDFEAIGTNCGEIQGGMLENRGCTPASEQDAGGTAAAFASKFRPPGRARGGAEVWKTRPRISLVGFSKGHIVLNSLLVSNGRSSKNSRRSLGFWHCVQGVHYVDPGKGTVPETFPPQDLLRHWSLWCAGREGDGRGTIFSVDEVTGGMQNLKLGASSSQETSEDPEADYYPAANAAQKSNPGSGPASMDIVPGQAVQPSSRQKSSSSPSSSETEGGDHTQTTRTRTRKQTKLPKIFLHATPRQLSDPVEQGMRQQFEQCEQDCAALGIPFFKREYFKEFDNKALFKPQNQQVNLLIHFKVLERFDLRGGNTAPDGQHPQQGKERANGGAKTRRGGAKRKNWGKNGGGDAPTQDPDAVYVASGEGSAGKKATEVIDFWQLPRTI